MVLISVDVESDGPCPAIYSMVCFGAVIILPNDLSNTYYGQTAPVSDLWIPEALSVSGFSREQHMDFNDPAGTMKHFCEWVKAASETHGKRPTMISDNPAFDFQFINYYFHRYCGENPFGWSARRIGDIYAGLMHNSKLPWKNKLRKTVHDHNPVNDAKGNAEAVLWISEKVKGLV